MTVIVVVIIVTVVTTVIVIFVAMIVTVIIIVNVGGERREGLSVAVLNPPSLQAASGQCEFAEHPAEVFQFVRAVSCLPPPHRTRPPPTHRHPQFRPRKQQVCRTLHKSRIPSPGRDGIHFPRGKA